MLRLVIEGKTADLYEFDPVELNLQFNDLTNVNTARSSYTQSFRIPLTETNSNILGAVNSLAAYTGFDIKRKLSAELNQDGFTIVRGYVQVKRFIQQKGRYMDAEIAFFGETANLSRTIGDKMLDRLELSSYNLPISAANILATWAGGSALTMGFVDRGQNWAGAGTWSTAAAGLQPTDATGFFDVQTLLTEIFAQSGLTFQSDFFDGQSGKLNLMLSSGGQSSKYTSTAQDVLFHVGLTSNLNFSNTAFQTFAFAETGAYTDPGNDLASGVWTAPYDGNYQFKVRVKFSVVPAAGDVRVTLFKNGVGWQDVVYLPASSITTAYNYQLFTTLQYLPAGTTLDVRYLSSTGSAGQFYGSGLTTAPTTSFECYNAQLAGAIYDVSANMPKMKQIDFLVGLQKTFNLAFIPDKIVSTHFYIEPLAEYFAYGNKKDWTNKIALENDVVIASTADLQRRTYKYDMQVGSDFIAQNVFNALGRPYGRFEIMDTFNDFAVGEEVVQSPFASFIPCPIPQTDFPVYRLINPDATPVSDPKPALAYFNGKIALGDYYFANVLRTEFPVFTDCEKWIPTIDSIDLNYGYDPKYRDVPAHSRDALYWKFWYPFTGELYSGDARIMEAQFRLTMQDVLNLNWSDRIFIENTLWRIMALQYVANDPAALVKATLLKIVAPERPCGFIPHQILKSGQVTFMGASGVTSQPSRTCCEMFGYRYDSTNGTCWGSFPLPTPKTYPEQA
jgi:hypothetical protein